MLARMPAVSRGSQILVATAHAISDRAVTTDDRG
jgi:hypothetical protein